MLAIARFLKFLSKKFLDLSIFLTWAAKTREEKRQYLEYERGFGSQIIFPRDRFGILPPFVLYKTTK